MECCRVCIHIQRPWSQFCHSFHACRPSNFPVRRNEQRWKPHACVYIHGSNHWLLDKQMSRRMEGMDIIHPHRTFPLPCSWQTDELRSSQASKLKRKIRLCHYVCVLPAHGLLSLRLFLLLARDSRSKLRSPLARSSVQQGWRLACEVKDNYWNHKTFHRISICT